MRNLDNKTIIFIDLRNWNKTDQFLSFKVVFSLLVDSRCYTKLHIHIYVVIKKSRALLFAVQKLNLDSQMIKKELEDLPECIMITMTLW